MSPVVTLDYRPHAKGHLKKAAPIDGMHPQEAFHRDRGRVFNRAVLAGASTGKTRAGAYEIVHCALTHPGSQWMAYEPTYPMVRRIMLPTLFRTLGQHPSKSPVVARYNENDHVIHLANDSTIHFGSLEHPEREEGTNLDGVWVDEPRLVRKWLGEDGAFNVLQRRLRGSGAGPEALVGMWITTSAPSKAIHDQWIGKGKEAIDSRRVYSWTPHDNPYNPAAFLRMMEASHSGASYDRFVLGKFAKPEGLVFHLNDDRVVTDDGPWDHVSGGVDWGWTHAAAIVTAHWRGEHCHLVQRLYGSHIPEEEVLDEVRRIDQELGGIKWRMGHDRPENISDLTREGLQVEASGGPGSVMASIQNILDLIAADNLTVDPGAVDLLNEWESLEWDPRPDRPDRILPGPDDGTAAARYAVAAGWRPAPEPNIRFL